MSVLVLNAGSSSIKYALFDGSAAAELAGGSVQRIGEETSELAHRWREAGVPARRTEVVRVADHAEALDRIFTLLAETIGLGEAVTLAAIGHRVVHGGERFRAPARIDAGVLAAIAAMEPLAPLHNPSSRLGIEVARRRCPDVPQVAVFDTAFHHTMPPRAYRYALPERVYAEHRVRRFGFHGQSHQYLARRAAGILGRRLEETRFVTLHLGNGASAAAVHGGASIDTSMGLTPLEGLVMGTRCGDLDPAVLIYLARRTGMTMDALEALLNRESGLKGLAGANDMREIHRRRRRGEAGAELAFDVFCYRVKKYIGAYFAALGGLDAIVFSGGIGVHDPAVRERCCAGLVDLGIDVDPARNHAAADGAAIQTDASAVAVLVLETDEEREIARQTLATVAGGVEADQGRAEPGG